MGDFIGFKALKEDSSKRIDKLLAEKNGITRSRIQAMLEEGLITVNENPVKANYRVKEGDIINIVPAKPWEGPVALIAEDIPIKLLYADEHIAVVEKPPGMVVYPAAGHARGTLINALKFHLKKLATVGGPLRPGVVHRLDKDTSGVMVVALSDSAYYGLVEQFKKRTVGRSYIALIYGNIKGDRGEIAFPIGRSVTDRKKMSTRVKRGRGAGGAGGAREAREALTTWEVLERFGEATLIRARLGTGRTHQIRVHFASIGHPVLGDRTYGKKTAIEIKRPQLHLKVSVTLARQMLHAALLCIVHPVTGELLEFETPLPDDMQEALESIRKLGLYKV